MPIQWRKDRVQGTIGRAGDWRWEKRRAEICFPLAAVRTTTATVKIAYITSTERCESIERYPSGSVRQGIGQRQETKLVPGGGRKRGSLSLLVDIGELAVVLELALGDVLELGGVGDDLVLDILEGVGLTASTGRLNAVGLGSVLGISLLLRSTSSLLDNAQFLSSLLLYSPAGTQCGDLDLAGGSKATNSIENWFPWTMWPQMTSKESNDRKSQHPSQVRHPIPINSAQMEALGPCGRVQKRRRLSAPTKRVNSIERTSPGDPNHPSRRGQRRAFHEQACGRWPSGWCRSRQAPQRRERQTRSIFFL